MKPNPQEHQRQIDEAIKQFRAWRDSKIACLDTETTGLTGRVWQFAAVQLNTLRPLLAFDCNPGLSLSEWSDVARQMMQRQDATGPHGAESSAYHNAVSVTLRENKILCWNAEFDMAAIERTWPDTGDGAVAACAMRAYAPIFGDWSESRNAWKFCTLDKALEAEEVYQHQPMPAHTAYGDAYRLALLVEAVAERETSSEAAERETAEDMELYGNGLEGPA